MEVHVLATERELGKAAAERAAEEIRKALSRQGEASIVLATGTSQFETLANLVVAPGIDWSRVTMFHLDEYIGLDENHPASFRRYLRERFVARAPSLRIAYFVNGNAEDLQSECGRLARAISAHPIDVALAGIGNNGHLGFNDPPADFDADEPYIVVTLAEACRRQQLEEGWFKTLAEVPEKAITMSIRQIMKSKRIVCSVPERRKARAVSDALKGPVVETCPASILQRHPSCFVYLDNASASLLDRKARVN